MVRVTPDPAHPVSARRASPLPRLLWTEPADRLAAAPVVLLAHGAGAAMDTPWMDRVAELLAERGVRVARFEFGYMAARREGARRPPPRAETLVPELREAVRAVRAGAGDAPLAIGGKSMGGRVATLAADELFDEGAVVAAACLGYPFHPPARPDRPRTAHLERLRTPTLVCQGTRDPFGTPEDVAGYRLSPAIRLVWLDDGDHDLRPRRSITGLGLDDHLRRAADEVSALFRGRPAEKVR